MTDHDYDISHLLVLEATRPEPPSRPSVSAPVAPPKPSVADAQNALAHELLQKMGGLHESLIEEYRGIAREPAAGAAVVMRDAY